MDVRQHLLLLWSFLHASWPELRVVVARAAPVAGSNFLQYLLLSATTMLCGHSGRVQMDGVALANSMINAMGFSVAIGLTTACDTLFSQGLGSAHPGRTGVFLTRSLCVFNLVGLVLTALHDNFEPILVHVLGQEADVAAVGGQFMRDFRFGVLFYFNYAVLARYLQAQGNCRVPLLAVLAGNAVNAGAQCLLLVLHAHTVSRAAYCQTAATVLMMAMELVYLVAIHEDRIGAWSGFSVEALEEWGSFGWLATCGLLHNSLEVISWEVGTVFAGIISQTALGVQTIVFQCETLVFTSLLGISIVINHQVGQSLGAGDPARAKRYIKAGFILTGGLAFVLLALVLALRDLLPLPFSDDAEVRSRAARLLPLVATCICIDGFEVLLAGVLRGCGRQRTGAVIVFVAYYLVGLPLGVSLGLAAGWGVPGLWVGTLVAVVLTTGLYAAVVRRLRWAEETAAAQRRVGVAPAPGAEEGERTPLLGPSPVCRRPALYAEEEDVEVAAARRRCRCPWRLVGRRAVLAAVCVALTVGGHIVSRWAQARLHRKALNGTTRGL